MGISLILGGIFVVALGTIPALYWKGQKKIQLRFFILGGFFWLVAATLEQVLNSFLNTPVRVGLSGIFVNTHTFFILFWALYLGLRGGLLECILPYLFADNAKIQRPSFEEAVAFGLGFSCFESVVLGSILLLVPSDIGRSSVTLLGIVEVIPQNMSFFLLMITLERAAMALIHVFVCLLVFAAIRSRKIAFLGEAILVKTVVKGGASVMSNAEQEPLLNALALGTPVLLLGIISVFGISKISKLGIFDGG